MKQLTYINSDRVLSEYLSEHYEVITQSEEMSEHVLIDWWPPDNAADIEQINVLEHAIKDKCKIAIFDRYCSLKHHEIEWLLRYKNVTLLEPCLVTRKGFVYLPFWYEYKDIIPEHTEHRAPVGIVKDLNRKNVLYDYDLPIKDLYEDLDFTILFGSKDEYQRGYLPNMNDILDSLCVPLLPIKHKYYSTLFWGLTVKEKDDIEYYLTMVKLTDAVIFGIYDMMQKMFPEMLVENVSRKIKSILT